MPVPLITKKIKDLRSDRSVKVGFWGGLVESFMNRKALNIWSRIAEYISGDDILDVGLGGGGLYVFLKNKGYKMTGIDVDNLSVYQDVKPVIYDGKTIPFARGRFDTAVIIHVLHHCDDGIRVLQEAKRVARRVIIIEDTYRNIVEKLVVGVGDCLYNFEFWWHTYRTPIQWEEIIRNNKWKIAAKREWSEFFISSVYGRYCMYVIE